MEENGRQKMHGGILGFSLNIGKNGVKKAAKKTRGKEEIRNKSSFYMFSDYPRERKPKRD